MKSQTLGTTTLGAMVISALIGATTAVPADQIAKDSSAGPSKIEISPAAPASTGRLPLSLASTPSTSPLAAVDPWSVLQALEAGWDGDNASTISPDAIAHAKSFVKHISYLGIDFSPYPDHDGSVGIEAEKPGKEALLVVDEHGLFSYVIADGSEVHRGDNISARKMRDLLAHLY